MRQRKTDTNLSTDTCHTSLQCHECIKFFMLPYQRQQYGSGFFYSFNIFLYTSCIFSSTFGGIVETVFFLLWCAILERICLPTVFSVLIFFCEIFLFIIFTPILKSFLLDTRKNLTKILVLLSVPNLSS